MSIVGRIHHRDRQLQIAKLGTGVVDAPHRPGALLVNMIDTLY